MLRLWRLKINFKNKFVREMKMNEDKNVSEIGKEINKPLFLLLILIAMKNLYYFNWNRTLIPK